MRSMMLAVTVSLVCIVTRSRPRYRVLRMPPTVFIQPNPSSIRFRIFWLMAYPTLRVVRPSKPGVRRPSTIAMFGVMLCIHNASTNALV